MKDEQVCQECQNTNGEHKLWCSRTTPKEWREPVEVDLVPTRWTFEGERFYYQVSLYKGNYSVIRVENGDPFIPPCMSQCTTNGWRAVTNTKLEKRLFTNIDSVKQVIQDSEMK